MADITFGVNLAVTKGFLDSKLSASNVTATMSETGLQSLTYSLTTNATSISTASLSSAGLAFMRNLATATSSTAQVGVVIGTSLVSFATLRPGEPAVLRLTAGSQYQATGTAGTRLRIDITEG